ncbi:hypothetical protein AMECASPLE_037930 [Ameca splendens]|uniref:Uncharacterized protein n=1 Tax=Ameca splendens TaxID=208324 RepID=A0ABV0Z5X3_9TELE
MYRFVLSYNNTFTGTTSSRLKLGAAGTCCNFTIHQQRASVLLQHHLSLEAKSKNQPGPEDGLVWKALVTGLKPDQKHNINTNIDLNCKEVGEPAASSERG